MTHYANAGVAISTTGHEHRLYFLEKCVAQWQYLLGSKVFVTVDGSREDTRRVREVLRYMPTVDVYRVGQHVSGNSARLGVAVSKNTGLELLWDAGLRHLFLCDDDTWPLNTGAFEEHMMMPGPHSMVCWGQWRRPTIGRGYASWEWPRGVMLYLRSEALSKVGGMVEAFGPGGHEHVEWSRRIHQHGLTPVPYISPKSYFNLTGRGPATGAADFWHAEDMPLPGEALGNLRVRRRGLTTLERPEDYQPKIDALMDARDGDTSFVPFRASANGRSSATLYRHI